MSDTTEFEAFLRTHQNMVYTTAYRLTANHAESQDIAQATFLKALERFAELRTHPAIGAWLRTVATHLALNHLTRYRKRWRFFSEWRSNNDGNDAPAHDIAGQVPDPSPLPLATADPHDTRALLERALARLPRDQRVALVLFHFHDLSYQEVADKLRVSLAKVKTDILRGRETLRKHLAPQRDELGPSP